jgi:hypothetical protein
VLKLGGDPDLAQESIGTDRGRELGTENLYGDRTLMPDIAGQVDGGHATLADQPLDGIAPFQGGAEQVEHIGHWSASEQRECPKIDWGSGVSQREGGDCGRLTR